MVKFVQLNTQWTVHRCKLVSSQPACMTYTYCCVYSARLLMMDRGTVLNM